MKKLFGVNILLCMVLGSKPCNLRGDDNQGGPKECTSVSGDANGDNAINVSDAITLLGHLFLGNPSGLLPTCRTKAITGLPDTSQSLCYEAIDERHWVPASCDSAPCRGQDGSYVTGCSSERRFIDNGDGTVTDTCTGLMWQKSTADTNGDGSSDENDYVAWCSALGYCENLDFASYDDWRLPNVRELQSIVDYGRFQSAIDPVFETVNSGGHWSSTNTYDTAWVVGFDHGGVGEGEPVLEGDIPQYYVRAVRSEICSARNGDINADGAIDLADALSILNHLFTGSFPVMPKLCELPLPDTGQTSCFERYNEIPCDDSRCPGQDGYYATGCSGERRFIDNRDGTVTDTCTGLMWQKSTADTNGDGSSDENDYLSWCSALGYCENLDFASYDDWRLPNVRELQSIFEYGRYGATLNQVFESPRHNCWTSTSYQHDPRHAFFINLDGSVTINGNNIKECVRPVRGGL